MTAPTGFFRRGKELAAEDLENTGVMSGQTCKMQVPAAMLSLARNAVAVPAAAALANSGNKEDPGLQRETTEPQT